MNELLAQSAYFSIALGLGAYWVGVRIKKRFPHPLVNPLLIASVIIAAVLLLLHVEAETFTTGIQPLTWLLTPSTVCLAIPLYRQLRLLRRHWKAIAVSITAGCLSCAVSVLLLAKLFRLTPEVYCSLLPKSVTTAIALGISEQLAGIAGVVTLAVIFTGLFGVVLAEGLLKLLRVTHPVAKGLAIGNSIHAIGTARAMEIGEIEGAISSLTIVVAGVLTVILAPIFSHFI